MKFYITTPIYYVNDMPHIGHAYTTIAADILARWHRLKGDEVMFLTGTDEHGAKICQSAEKKGAKPQELCDEYSLQFKNAWKKLNISFDDFIRTTEQRHIDTVTDMLQKLYDRGLIYKKKYEGLYCVGCEKFLSDSDLNEDKCCPDHKQKPITHSEENYFFKLSGFTNEMLNVLTDEKHPKHYAVLPAERRNEILGKLKKTGLEDISISRSSLDWGIPLPFDKKQTVYVWVDALINYVSGVGYTSDKDKFNKFWPCSMHLMAKDILWFHSIIWPAILLGCEMPLPKKMFAHGFFTIDGQKMSKTIGNVIHPEQLIEKYGVDAARYLTLSLFPFGVDGDISWKALTDKYNTDLANNLGNLISRTLTMVEKYFDGKTPSAEDTPAKVTLEIKQVLETISINLDNMEFHLAIEKLQKAIDISNRYIQEKAPWKMAKENPGELPAVIFSLLQNIALISIFLYPIMPTLAQTIWEAAGCKEKIESAAKECFDNNKTNFVLSGSHIKNPGILFPRIIQK